MLHTPDGKNATSRNTLQNMFVTLHPCDMLQTSDGNTTTSRGKLQTSGGNTVTLRKILQTHDGNFAPHVTCYKYDGNTAASCNML
jgi:hypothetical protein